MSANTEPVPDELVPEETAGFVVASKKTLDEIEKLGLYLLRARPV
jgi:hypothetical protein